MKLLSLVTQLVSLTTSTQAFVRFSQQNRCQKQHKQLQGIIQHTDLSRCPTIAKRQPTHLFASTLINPAKITIKEDLQPLENEIETKDEQTSTKSYLNDGFVFGMEGSGLERPKGKQANLVIEGDFLEAEPYQVAIVVSTMAAHLGFMSNAYTQIISNNDGDILLTLLQSMIILVSTWIAADFGSGIFHWSVDNYGNGRTPILGTMIAAFQGHHSAPWTITERDFCNNVYKLCVPFGIPTIALINAISGPRVTLFFAVFCVLEIMSQELHKWSHMSKKDVPETANWLQDNGLAVNRIQHAKHHTAPYEGNYCIVSGFNNEWMDNSGIYRRMEHIIYKMNGVESNAWKLDPELREKTLNGDYSVQN